MILTDADFADITSGSEDPLLAAIQYAAGAASSCWEHLDGTGHFQSDRAAQISADLARWLRTNPQLVDGQNPQIAGLNGCTAH